MPSKWKTSVKKHKVTDNSSRRSEHDEDQGEDSIRWPENKGDEDLWKALCDSDSNEYTRDWFYTAAILLEQRDPPYCWPVARIESQEDSQSACADGNKRDCQTARGRLLDAKNVTAAALSDPRTSRDGVISVTIYVAKNDGSQSFDNKSDIAFAKQLQDWYNGLGKDQASVKNDQMWKDMQDFWRRQLEHSVQQICGSSANRGLTTSLGRYGHALSSHSPPDDLIAEILELNAYDDNVTNKRLFKDDCEHFGKLLKWLDDLHRKPESIEDINLVVKHICIDAGQEWKLSYQRTGGGPADYEDFRRTIKHFKKLRFLKSLWGAFHEYRKIEPCIPMKIRFLARHEARGVQTAKLAEELVRTWSRYWAPLIARDEYVQPEHTLTQDQKARRLKQVSDSDGKGSFAHTVHGLKCHLKEQKILPRYLHCELQLAFKICDLAFMTADAPSDEFTFRYLGCSKLSCFLCTRMLPVLGFSTKDTRGKLRANCAFWDLDRRNPVLNVVTDCLNGICSEFAACLEPLARPNETEENNIIAVSDTATYEVSRGTRSRTFSNSVARGSQVEDQSLAGAEENLFLNEATAVDDAEKRPSEGSSTDEGFGDDKFI